MDTKYDAPVLPAVPSLDELAQTADLYAEALALKTACDNQYKPLFAAFEAQHNELIELRNAAAKGLKTRDAELREAVKAFYASGIGAPDIDGIKVTQDSAAVYDDAELLRYAVAHGLTWMLKIDDEVLMGLAVGLLSDTSEKGARAHALRRMIGELPATFTKVPSVDLSQPTLLKRAVNGDGSDE